MKTIADLRKEKNITQAQLAELLGVTKSTVGNWETGIRIPGMLKAIKLASVFGVGIGEIIFLPSKTTKCEQKHEKKQHGNPEPAA